MDKLSNIYKNRFEDYPQLKIAYENACDCHYYGMGSNEWNDCRIGEMFGKEWRKLVWNRAFWDVAEPDNKQFDFADPVYA